MKTPIMILPHLKLEFFFSCAPGSTEILVWARNQTSAVKWEVTSSIDCNLGFFGMAFLSAGSYLTVIGSNDTHQTWIFDDAKEQKLKFHNDNSGDHQSLKLKGRKTGHSKVNAVGCSRVGRWMASAGDNNTLLLYMMDTTSQNWVIVGERKKDVNYDGGLVSVEFSPNLIRHKRIVATGGGKGYVHFWAICKKTSKYETPERVHEMYKFKSTRPDFVNEIAPPTPVPPDDRDSSSDSQNYKAETLVVPDSPDDGMADSNAGLFENPNAELFENPLGGNDAVHDDDVVADDDDVVADDVVADDAQQIIDEAIELQKRHDIEYQNMKQNLVTWIEGFETVRERQKAESAEVINRLKDAADVQGARVRAVHKETLKMQQLLESRGRRKNLKIMCKTILEHCKGEGSSGAEPLDPSEVTPPPKKSRKH